MQSDLRTRLAIVAVMVATVITPRPAAAQDSHYWAEQFGNRSYLLSGAVVADPADLSAVYYNPGGLALNEATEFLLAGLGIELSSLVVRDALGEGGDLAKTETQFVPSLIAGEIPIERAGHRFAYSLLTRHRNELSAFAKVDLPGDFFELPELRLLSSSLEINTELSEYWLGGTWSWRVRPGFGVGVSTFVAGRNQRAATDSSVQLLGSDNLAAAAVVGSGYKYQYWRLLWKIGAVGQIARWNLGVTVTTKGLGLGGTGDVSVNRTIVGQTVDEDGTPLTSIATNVQYRIPADYRSPFSIAVGASRSFGATRLHVTAEHFEAVGPYKVLPAEPFTAQSSGVTIIDPSVVQSLDSVTNVALAAEHVFASDTRAYVGFHTDFSGASRDPSANLALAKWDLYHVSGGATFDVRGTALTLGADVAFASEKVQSARDDPFRPVTLPDDTDVDVARVVVILGFNFSF